jgi:hypothetical protein
VTPKPLIDIFYQRGGAPIARVYFLLSYCSNSHSRKHFVRLFFLLFLLNVNVDLFIEHPKIDTSDIIIVVSEEMVSLFLYISSFLGHVFLLVKLVQCHNIVVAFMYYLGPSFSRCHSQTFSTVVEIVIKNDAFFRQFSRCHTNIDFST